MTQEKPKDGMTVEQLADIMRRWDKGQKYIPFPERRAVIRYAAIGIVVSRFMDGERPLGDLVTEALSELDHMT